MCAYDNVARAITFSPSSSVIGCATLLQCTRGRRWRGAIGGGAMRARGGESTEKRGRARTTPLCVSVCACACVCRAVERRDRDDAKAAGGGGCTALHSLKTCIHYCARRKNINFLSTVRRVYTCTRNNIHLHIAHAATFVTRYFGKNKKNSIIRTARYFHTFIFAEDIYIYIVSIILYPREAYRVHILFKLFRSSEQKKNKRFYRNCF